MPLITFESNTDAINEIETAIRCLREQLCVQLTTDVHAANLKVAKLIEQLIHQIDNMVCSYTAEVDQLQNMATNLLINIDNCLECSSSSLERSPLPLELEQSKHSLSQSNAEHSKITGQQNESDVKQVRNRARKRSQSGCNSIDCADDVTDQMRVDDAQENVTLEDFIYTNCKDYDIENFLIRMDDSNINHLMTKLPSVCLSYMPVKLSSMRIFPDNLAIFKHSCITSNDYLNNLNNLKHDELNNDPNETTIHKHVSTEYQYSLNIITNIKNRKSKRAKVDKTHSHYNNHETQFDSGYFEESFTEFQFDENPTVNSVKYITRWLDMTEYGLDDGMCSFEGIASGFITRILKRILKSVDRHTNGVAQHTPSVIMAKCLKKIYYECIRRFDRSQIQKATGAGNFTQGKVSIDFSQIHHAIYETDKSISTAHLFLSVLMALEEIQSKQYTYEIRPCNDRVDDFVIYLKFQQHSNN
ncbi:hypothetical protein GJ496_007182 [Pomphorhynchus laevis]|nr:hypothetical protein GJ496_007182 [Pomphorhynchus laevis]